MSRRGENIYKRKDGRWEGRIRLNNNSKGKSAYKSVYGKTYKSVKEKLILMRTDNITTDIPSSRNVRVLFEEWFSSVKLKVKPSTYSNYRMKAEKHILTEFGDMRYEQIDVNMVHRFIEKKLSCGLSEKYVSDIMIVFRSMARYMNRVYGMKNIIGEATMPRISKKEITVLDETQQMVLYRYLTENMNSTSICILLSFYTGIRIGEVCCLTWNDIDLDKNIIKINKTVQRMQDIDLLSTKIITGPPKSESSKRTIPLSPFLAEILAKHRKSPNTYVFSGNESITEPRTLQRRFKTVLKNAGLPDIHYHSLRHMFATNCIKKGFDVRTLSEILGHSSVETTLNRYVHSSMSRKIECMNMITPAV